MMGFPVGAGDWVCILEKSTCNKWDKWKEERVEAGEIWKEEIGSKNKVTDSRSVPRAATCPGSDAERRFHCGRTAGGGAELRDSGLCSKPVSPFF